MKISKTKIVAASVRGEDVGISTAAVDFTHSGDYDVQAIMESLNYFLDQSGYTLLEMDFREVDYSGYPEFRDKIVTQLGFDFYWGEVDYDSEVIKQCAADALEENSCELIGIDIYTLDDYQYDDYV